MGCTHVNCTLRIAHSLSTTKNKMERKEKKQLRARSWSVTADSRREVAYKVTHDFTVKSPLLEVFGPAPAGLSGPLFPSFPCSPSNSATAIFRAIAFPLRRCCLFPSCPSTFSSTPSPSPSRVRRFFFSSIIYLPTSARAPFTSGAGLTSSPRSLEKRRYAGTSWICRASRTRRTLTQGYDGALR